MKHRDCRLLEEFSELAGDCMRQLFDHRVLGPDLPPVARVQQQYIRKIVLKIENNISQYRVNETLMALQHSLLDDKRYRGITMFYDIDPL